MNRLKHWIHWLRIKLRLTGPDLDALQKRGLRLGKDTNIQPGVIIDASHCWLIEIGDRVTIAPTAMILAHDASTLPFIGYAKVAQVRIGTGAFIGAGAIILPGSKIGDYAVIGAGAVVSGEIPPGMIAVGVPARPVMTVAEYRERELERMSQSAVFDESYTVRGKITEAKRREMIDRVSSGVGYVR